KMLLVPSFPVRDGKPADRPTLTARPTRFLRVPLEGALAAYDAGLAAVDDQMVGGPIRPEEVAVGGGCVRGGDGREARVPGLPGGPPEEREVHHRVDCAGSQPAGIRPRSPGLDVPAVRHESGGKR